MLDATPLLRLAAHYRSAELARLDPVEAQRRTLRDLIRRAAHTEFGRAHGFANIETVTEYQARVRPRRYEAFWREWWEPAFPRLLGTSWPGLMPYFAESSGTTAGASKFIPVSDDMVRANRASAQDALCYHVLNHPNSRILGGENFLLGGSTGLRRLALGVRAGDLSGIAAATIPPYARLRAFPPLSLALISDWDEKLDRLARASLNRDIRTISGTPSWLLLLFERLSSLHPARPRSLRPIWPNLELVLHGGVGFGPYRAAFAGWMDGCHAETREVYAASEGFIAAADAGPQDGMRLQLDRGLFFEFIPPADLDNPDRRRLWIADVETGRDYALVLSSNAGLFSYIVGDTVRFVSLSPPRIVFAGRLAHTLSAFGEHLTGGELDAAMETAAREFGGAVTDYTAATRLPDSQEARGRHIFAVCYTGPEVTPERFAVALDQALIEANADYAAHRARDVQLLPPEIRFVAAERFTDWMRARGRLGGQNKVPRVVGSEADLPG